MSVNESNRKIPKQFGLDDAGFQDVAGDATVGDGAQTAVEREGEQMVHELRARVLHVLLVIALTVQVIPFDRVPQNVQSYYQSCSRAGPLK